MYVGIYYTKSAQYSKAEGCSSEVSLEVSQLVASLILRCSVTNALCGSISSNVKKN
jgi:hypothetical protein